MKRSRSQIDEENISSTVQDDDNEDNLFNFIPPLHIQRKRKVLDIVMGFIRHNYPEKTNMSSVLKLVDVGCERGAFFQYFQTELIGIKNKFDTKYIGIDISEFTLSNETVENLRKFSIGNSSEIRNGSVSVKLLHENILYPSYHLDRPDVLVMIEVIEHIPLDEVNNRLPHSIFGEICPKVVVITTPNADFNEIFGIKSRFQFRHWDHKFEWTRNEFKCWCANVIALFPEYQYEISDIGTTNEFPLHGGGSQVGVFVRITPQRDVMTPSLSSNANIVYDKDNLISAQSEYDVIRNFVSYKMSLWAMEKHVSITDVWSDAGIEMLDKSMGSSPSEEMETEVNLGTLEYDDFNGLEIFKIPVDVVERIIRNQFPNIGDDIDIGNLLRDCSRSSIYFKMSDDDKQICYCTYTEKEDCELDFYFDYDFGDDSQQHMRPSTSAHASSGLFDNFLSLVEENVKSKSISE